MPLKRQTAANGKCQAKTKASRQCAAPAVRGSAFCALHSDPNRAAGLGRKGGARNRKVYDGEVRNASVPESGRRCEADADGREQTVPAQTGGRPGQQAVLLGSGRDDRARGVAQVLGAAGVQRSRC